MPKKLKFALEFPLFVGGFVAIFAIAAVLAVIDGLKVIKQHIRQEV